METAFASLKERIGEIHDLDAASALLGWDQQVKMPPGGAGVRAEQLEAVRALQREGALERLPERLYEVARLRLRYPQLPLRELAAKCEPPTTKASVHRRLKKVQELAFPS